MSLTKVVIVAATHGNENTGPYLLKSFAASKTLAQYNNLQISTLLANPKAWSQKIRFVDDDLNKCFSTQSLRDTTLVSYEHQQARYINQLLGPKHKPSIDLIIDIHTTTANMGITLILAGDDPLGFRIAAYVQRKLEHVAVLYLPIKAEQNSALSSIAHHAIAIEVGPIANGLVRHDCLQKTQNTVHACLEFLQSGRGANERHVGSLEVFKYIEPVFYPTDAEGHITALVHLDLQDRDFLPLRKGDKLFQCLDGSTVSYQRDETVYPVFINEAAYYDQKIAFSLAKKRTIKL